MDLGAATGVARSYLTGVLKTWAEEAGIREHNPQGTFHRIITTVCAQPLLLRRHKMLFTIFLPVVTGDNYFATSDVA